VSSYKQLDVKQMGVCEELHITRPTENRTRGESLPLASKDDQ